MNLEVMHHTKGNRSVLALSAGSRVSIDSEVATVSTASPTGLHQVEIDMADATVSFTVQTSAPIQPTEPTPHFVDYVRPLTTAIAGVVLLFVGAFQIFGSGNVNGGLAISAIGLAAVLASI